MSPPEKITKQPLFLIYYDNTFILVYITGYVHILQVYLHTLCTYHPGWSSIIAYSVYIPSVSPDTPSIMRYARECSYMRKENSFLHAHVATLTYVSQYFGRI